MISELLDWLRADEAMNLPVIGDMIRYGLSAHYHEVWVQCNEEGLWTALIRRFFDHFILYVPQQGADVEELGSFLRFSDPLSVSGARPVIRQIQPFLSGFTEEVSQQMILHDDKKLELPPEYDYLSATGLTLDLATMEDAAEIGALIFGTYVFGQNYESAAEVTAGILSRMGSGGIRHIVLRLHGRIVSHANTTTETNGYVLISGITTQVNFQRQGYAGLIVSFLCRQLLSEGRLPCLFCKSPAAFALYRKLGFVEIGEYATLYRVCLKNETDPLQRYSTMANQ